MKSIRSQMLVYLLSFFLIVFLALGFFIMRQLNQLPQYIRNQYQEVTRVKANETNKELAGLLDHVRILAQSSLVQSMDIEAMKSHLPSLVLEDKFYSITISDRDGNAWTTYDANINISEQEQYKKIIEEGHLYHISRPFYSPLLSDPVPIITISHGVFRDGETVGLINIVLTSEFLDAIIQDYDFEKTSYAYILHADGHFIAYPNEVYTIDQFIGEIIDLDQLDSFPTGDEGYFTYLDKEGNEEIAFYRSLELVPDWYFIMAVEEAQAFIFYNNAVMALQFAFAVFIVIIIGFAVIYSETISRPITSMIATFELASKGNLDVRASEKSRNELGNAGRSFNRMIEQIKALTYHDTITGLYNIRSFKLELARSHPKTELSQNIAAIVIVSLDDFKRINSLGGYEVGNEVLKKLSDRFNAFRRKNELVGRYFGDEIIFYTQAETEKLIDSRVQNLVELLNQPMVLKGIEYKINASIGVRIIPKKETNLERMIHEATIAKLVAKAQVGHAIRYYDEAMNRRVIKEQSMEEELHHALQKNEFYLVYQPIVSKTGRKISGVEVLLRWNHPTFHTVPIIDVIKLLERKGLIFDVGRWVMNTAIKEIKRLNERYHLNLTVSINVSALQLEDARFQKTVADCLAATKINPQLVYLEITETVMMSNVEYSILMIEALKKLNVMISMDDFGTGYSSLAYIMRLPIDELKIDRSFIGRLNETSKSQSIVKTMATLARSLNVVLTAEGIETIQQYKIVQSYDFDFYQGYFFHRPITIEALDLLLKETNDAD